MPRRVTGKRSQKHSLAALANHIILSRSFAPTQWHSWYIMIESSTSPLISLKIFDWFRSQVTWSSPPKPCIACKEFAWGNRFFMKLLWGETAEILLRSLVSKISNCHLLTMKNLQENCHTSTSAFKMIIWLWDRFFKMRLILEAHSFNLPLTGPCSPWVFQNVSQLPAGKSHATKLFEVVWFLSVGLNHDC